MPIRCFLAFLAFQTVSLFSYAQDSDEDLFKVEYDSPLTIDLEEEIEKDEESVLFSGKNKKKNIFYGVKTKKGFTKRGYGTSQVIEKFRFLKNYQEPPAYVQDVYWYDYKRKKIIKSKSVKQGQGFILHGPYEKTVNVKATEYEIVEEEGEEKRKEKKIIRPQIIEKGVFYFGVKHARWTRWNKSGILISKEKWYKGWPKEAKMAYYNKEERKIKEVIPVQNGERSGQYYAFHKNGSVAAYGRYEHDERIGKWYEYYDYRGRKKKEVQYPKEALTDEKPVVLREWNKKGRITYDIRKVKKN